jgi:hypothetical protein
MFYSWLAMIYMVAGVAYAALGYNEYHRWCILYAMLAFIAREICRLRDLKKGGE